MVSFATRVAKKKNLVLSLLVVYSRGFSKMPLLYSAQLFQKSMSKNGIPARTSHGSNLWQKNTLFLEEEWDIKTQFDHHGSFWAFHIVTLENGFPSMLIVII